MNELDKKGRNVLFSAFIINICWGLMYTWSLISKSLVKDKGWTSSQALLPYTLFSTFFVFAMIISGELQDRKGPKPVIFTGIIIAAIGFISAGIFIYPMALNISIGVLTGIGVGTITAATSPPVIKWFLPEKKGLVTGIVVAGTGISSILFAPLMEYLILHIGVSKALIVIGSIAFVISLFFVNNMVNPPEDYIKRSSEIKISGGKNYIWSEMLKDLTFYKVWLVFTLSLSGGLMIIGHVATIADVQIGWQLGFILVMLMALFNASGRFLGGVISDRLGRFNFIKINLIIQLINLVLFRFYSNKILLIIGVAISALCYGANFSVFPSITSDLYGMKHFGLNYGIMYSSLGIGGTIGPMIAAKVFDNTGNYFLAYKIGAVLIAIAFIMSFTIENKYKKVN